MASAPLIPQIKQAAFNPSMKTIAEIRLANLELLIQEQGTQERVAEKADTSSVYLSQIRNQTPDAKTKKLRQMGDEMARKLEVGCGKEHGWMDNTHGADSTHNKKLAAAINLLEHMEEWQIEQALKVIDALSEPRGKGNGTSG